MRRKKELLILGATGDLGSSLVDTFLSKDFNIYILHRKNSEIAKFKNKKSLKLVQFEKLNLLPDEILKRSFDIVINSAGKYFSDSNETVNRETFTKTIDDNFFSLLDYFNSVKKSIKKTGIFINISSIASNYGSKMEFSYSSSKLIVDKFLLEQTLNKKNNFKILNIKPGAFLSKTTSKRKDKKLISTTQLANTIYKLSTQEESIYISSIEIFGIK